MKAEILQSKVHRRVIGKFIRIVYYPVHIFTIVFSCRTTIKYCTIFHSMAACFPRQSALISSIFPHYWLMKIHLPYLCNTQPYSTLTCAIPSVYIYIYIYNIMHFIFFLIIALVEFVRPIKGDQLYVTVKSVKISTSTSVEMSKHKKY